MKVELTMDDNTLTAIQDIAEKAFAPRIMGRTQLSLTLDFNIIEEKRLDNSANFTLVPSKMEVKIL